MPEGEGYPASPQDEREFPDLAPIRPRDARARDARPPGDWNGQPGPAGGYGQPDRYGEPGQYSQQSGGSADGYPPAGARYGQPGQGQAEPGFGAGQYGTAQYGAGPYETDQRDGGQYGAGQRGAGQYGPGRPGAGPAGTGGRGGYADAVAEPGQAPWADQEWPDRPLAGQAGRAAAASQPQARLGQSQPPAGPDQPQRDAAGPPKQEEDVPSWAEPDSVEAFSARWHRRGLDSRDERRSGRRNRRRLLIAGGGVLVVVIAVAVYFLTSGGGSSANLGLGSLVTTFLPGEVQSVPDACDTVPSATLSQFLPGSPKEAAPPLNSGTDSQCSWTLDDAPTYRVLEVQIEAYTPSALVANSTGTGLVPVGNGSATYAAEAALASYEYNLVHPAAKSGQPAAAVAAVSGMPGGNDTSAFSATQVFDRSGANTDEATVYVRYRNVIVIAVMEGPDKSSGGQKYRPVSMSDLTTAAETVAKQVTGQIVH